jgi:ATP-dependent Lon protease
MNSDLPGQFWDLVGKSDQAKSSAVVGFPVSDPKIFFFSVGNECEISLEHGPNLEVVEFWEMELRIKVEIARSSLVPAAFLSAGKRQGFSFSDDAIRKLVTGYTSEPGVSELSDVIRKITQMAVFKYNPVRQFTNK